MRALAGKDLGQRFGIDAQAEQAHAFQQGQGRLVPLLERLAIATGDFGEAQFLLQHRSPPGILFFRGGSEASEEVFLGPDARQTDIWGQSRPLAGNQDRHSIQVGRLPTFVTGASPEIVRWRQATGFESANVPHVFGRPHPNRLLVTNSFDVAVSGSARLVMPDGWAPSPDRIEFQLDPGEPGRAPFEVVLPFNADSGKQPVRIDFDIMADRRYRFSVHRQIEVGMGDVVIHVTSRLGGRNQGDA